MEEDVTKWSASQTYHFLVSAVAPRPIAWVTTKSAGVVNAAPFSWFQTVCADPPLLMIAIAKREPEKDTLRNIRATKEFVINAATAPHAQAIVDSSAEMPATTSEVDALGLATAPAVAVSPPRLAASPIHFECVLEDIQDLGGAKGTHLVIGRVVHVHVDDALLDTRGNVRPDVPFLARLGGHHYTVSKDIGEVRRPS